MRDAPFVDVYDFMTGTAYTALKFAEQDEGGQDWNVDDVPEPALRGKVARRPRVRPRAKPPVAKLSWWQSVTRHVSSTADLPTQMRCGACGFLGPYRFGTNQCKGCG